MSLSFKKYVVLLMINDKSSQFSANEIVIPYISLMVLDYGKIW